MSIGPLGTKFSEISIKLPQFSFRKTHVKIPSVKRHLICHTSMHFDRDCPLLGLLVITLIGLCVRKLYVCMIYIYMIYVYIYTCIVNEWSTENRRVWWYLNLICQQCLQSKIIPLRPLVWQDFLESRRPFLVRSFCDRNHYNDVIMSSMASQITSVSIVYSTVYSGADQRKHQSYATLAFVRVIHRWPVNSPHKGPVTRKMFPFDDVIMRNMEHV